MRVTDKTDKTPEAALVGSPPRLLQELRGASGPDAARSGRPVGAEPRVEVEAHRGPPPVRGPVRLRANPAQLLEALERALHETQGSVRPVHSWRYTPRAR